ncbi:MAG TPA: hypothetical protein VK003_16495 [Oceanobacillus sp.]|nr:hypothetical protein [Oceanobacillus sp.]
MTLNDIVTLLKEGLDHQFFNLEYTVWTPGLSESDRATGSELHWEMNDPTEDFRSRISDLYGSVLQTLVRHNLFSDIDGNWYRINPSVVETIYQQLNARR